MIVNLIWGLYYGLGFEPAFVWYKIHGPFPTGFLDLFAMIIYPVAASTLLYWAIFRLTERRSHRKWVGLTLGLSFVLLIPMPYSQLDDWWLHPIWIFGAMGEPP
ncbi:MAG: hypothetical protein ISS15_04895 [Alphaproteobacteria bacterium]|nr:hypothetical protein [Alphaproteobacteria bacterium]MBL6939701.1 hypothetical protein [Alphaproteobacteria bacterium]MBL7096977.1 hypothetical protein [Alphaproteobacteria bacterium]